ncbi:Luciferase [Minicystis rosea]|nr:Luciferase [Minicystis rosea]
MKIDIFSELQHPRELWEGEDHEHRLIKDAIEQARLADELGYGCWWQVEHHTAEEFSHSSAPEIMLAAIAQHTKRIRIGQSAALSPFRFNHPIRIAERAAFLDHVSDGRFELGLARSTIPEWRVFNIPAGETRAQMQQAFEMIPQMWTQDRFSWKSEFFEINNVPIVPKPYQKPGPRLWQACGSPTSFEQAGKNGVGALGVTLWASLDEVAEMIDLYRRAIARCEKPVGGVVNNQVAFFTFAHCVESHEEAMANGAAKAAAWYTNGSFTFFEAKELFLQSMAETEAAAKDPAGGGLTGQYARNKKAGPPSRAQQVIGRIVAGESVPDEEVYEVLSGQQSLIVGSPDDCRKKLKVYQDLGIDRLMSFHQVGALRHPQVMKSIRMLSTLIPEFDPPSAAS